MSHNASYEDLQHEFHHSGETIHLHTKAIFNVIPSLTYRFVKQTTGVETHWKISTDPRFFPNFENCLGAIDGTHVPITISQDRQAPYRNRKGYLKSKCDVERAIGVLKKRFPILKVGTHHPIENQVKIPAAAVVFHNLIRMLNGDEGWLDHQGSNISPEHFIDVPEGGNQYSNDVMSLSSQIFILSLSLIPDFYICSNNVSKRVPKVQFDPSCSCPKKAISKDFKSSKEKGIAKRIFKLFHEKFPHVKFTRVQIQDKEKELKREYRVLKEARKQSGQTAKGTLNFTSIAPSQVLVTQPSQVPITQPSQVPVTQPSQAIVTQHYIGEEDENFPLDSSVHNVETDDDDLRILEQPVASGAATRSRMGKRVASTRNKDTTTSDKIEKAAQRRRQDGKVIEMMGRFIEMKEKQAEAESMQQERARSNQHEDEFHIPVCIAVVDKMEDLSDDEKVVAYDVFKDPQNRAIFMTAKDSTRLKWLRKKIN
ncbi:unnamed protein product [Miscanthus lutarioriparius]|uniref:DDE Tnp4 domain-containing protein n=1 Tax=Miscanthus lutarioriparius TaxID=422564 RepID=A0A811SBD4_9POAL|nr:unnamed protein product [Miscanthus lutarioriparius]